MASTEQPAYSYEDDPYGFGLGGPSIALNATFLALFGVSLIIHTAQLAISRRYWWMAVMPIGLVLEVMGWSARIWSHFDLPGGGYIMQICLLVLAPTFFSAALYWAGGLIIAAISTPQSAHLLSPKWFKILFIGADILSLVLQGIGGGLAGSAADDAEAQLNSGTKVMLAGIIIQLVVMILFSFYMLGWAWVSRERLSETNSRLQLMLGAIGVASVAIIIRGCFRTAELNGGFHGPLAINEPMIILDAAPVAVCVFVLNVIHPHWFLRSSPSSHDETSQTTMTGTHSPSLIKGVKESV